jgi:hypothetical protein
MPFGHGIEDSNHKENGFFMNDYVKSGPGYTISRDIITDEVSAEIHNSSSKEPASSTGWLVALPIAIVGAIQVFVPDLFNDGTWSNIYYFMGFAAPLITAFTIRGKVWSPASVSKVIREALEAAEQTRKS